MFSWKRVESRERPYFSMNHSLGGSKYIFDGPHLRSQSSEFGRAETLGYSLEISFHPRFFEPPLIRPPKYCPLRSLGSSSSVYNAILAGLPRPSTNAWVLTPPRPRHSNCSNVARLDA